MVRPQKVSITRMATCIARSAGITSTVARMAGVSRQTVYCMFRQFPELAELHAETREETLDIVESALLRKCKGGIPWAIKFYLERKGRARGYGPQLTIGDSEIVGQSASKIVITKPRDRP